MTIYEAAKKVTDSKSVCQIRAREYAGSGVREYDCREGMQGKKRGWTYLDLFTASAITKVAEALSEASRARYLSLPLSKLITVTWKLVK